MSRTRQYLLALALRCLCIALLCAAPQKAPADVPGQSDWSIKVLQQSDGLPTNNVYDLAQTPDGYLWVATSAGLVRFDGNTFQQFPMPHPFDEGGQSIGAVSVTPAGGLLIGVNRGAVLRLNPDEPPEIDLLPDKTWPMWAHLLEAPDGTIWATFHSGDVGRVRNGKIERIGAAEGLPADSAECTLIQDKNGQVWAAKGSWIGKLHNDRFAQIIQIAGARLRIAPAAAGGIWISNGRDLLHCSEAGILDPRASLPVPATVDVTTILEDHTGVLWIGTAYQGLFRFNGTTVENVPTSHPHISCLLEDRDRNLWAGTRGGGLDRVQPRAILLQGDEAGLPVQSIQSIAEDAHRTLWAVTQDGGLRHLVNNAWVVDSTQANWPGGDATCVTADDAGAVWIGTRNGQLYRWKDGRYTAWGRESGITSRNVSGLLAATNGDLWLAMQNKDAVYRLRNEQILIFPLPDGVRHVRALAEDPAGHVWIATEKGSLFQADGDKLVDRTDLVKAGVESLQSCFWSPDGALWMAAGRSGLVRLKDGKLSAIDENRGLFDSRILQMIPDGRGWLWCCAAQGIFKVRLQELNDVADGTRTRVQSVHYGDEQGLPSLEPGFGLTARPLRTHDGRLWMMMGTALAIVSPDKVREQMQPPPVHLERVVAGDQVAASYHSTLPASDPFDLQSHSTGLVLEPGRQRVEFDFTAVSFDAATNVRFQYRLDGVDDHWLDGGAQRSAVYSKVSAGDYQFHVRACNSDGVWNEQGATLAFTVKPLFWQTWWFQALAALVFTGLVVVLARYVSFRRLRRRVELLEQQSALHKERARIARDLHDDLGARLTKIVMLSDMSLRDNGHGSGDRAHQISSAARQSIKSLDETVWAVNPRNDTLPHLIDYAGQFAVEFLSSARIRCRVDLLENSPDRPVSAETRHHVLLVVKEVLNNIVRHAAATEVWLRVSLDADFICLAIEDNGRGFVFSENGNGDMNADGLRNIAHRMREIAGRSEIHSTPGEGTRISLIFPWSAKELTTL